MPTLQRIYRLMITPETWVDILEANKWVMAQTDEYLLSYGEKKHLQSIDNKAKSPTNPRHWYNIKNRYMQYINYKEKVREECRRVSYLPRTHDFWLKAYFPMPKSWPRKKRNSLEWEPHLATPDADNIFKAYGDAVFPKKDSFVYDFRVSKFWVATSFGWIDIEIGSLPKSLPNLTLPSELHNDELK